MKLEKTELQYLMPYKEHRQLNSYCSAVSKVALCISVLLVLSPRISWSYTSSALDSLQKRQKLLHRNAQYEEATVICQNLLEHYSESNQHEAYINQKMFYAELLRASRLFDFSIDELSEAETIARTEGILTHRLLVKINLKKGAVCYEQQDLKCALDFLETAEHEFIMKQVSDPKLKSELLILKSAIERSSLNFEPALTLIDSALVLTSTFEDKDLYITASINKLWLYRHQKNWEPLLELCQQIEPIIGEYGAKGHLLELYTSYFAYYRRMDDLDKALFYRGMLAELGNIIMTERSSQRLEFINSEWQLKQRKLQNEILRKEEAKTEAQLIATLILLVLSIASMLFIYRSRLRLRKKTEELQKVKEQLEKRTQEHLKTIELQNKLFAIIGHDLKGPVNSIHQSIDLINKKVFDEKEQSIIMTEIQESSGQLALLLENLLRWAKSQDNKLSANIANVPLQPVIQDLVELYTTALKRKEIQLDVELPSDAIYGKVDRELISLVVRNLLSNAIKFTNRSGAIRIALRAEGDKAVIEIEDNGIGMSQEQLDGLFSKAVMHSYGTENEKGTGLGLQFCKEAILLNKGELIIQSEKNKGTTIIMEVPLA